MHNKLSREKLEQKIADLEERLDFYEKFAEYAYNWEYFINQDFTVKYVTPSCMRITGYTPAEFYANKELISHIIHPDDRIRFKEHVHALNENGERIPIDFRIITKSGEVEWISHICHNIRDNSGMLIGIRASNRIITNRKNYEIALKQSEKKFRVLFEQSTEAIIISDFEGNIIDCNREALINQGIETIEAFLQFKIADFFMLPSELKSIKDEVLKNGFVKNKEVQIKTPNGIGFPALISVNVMALLSKQVYITWIRDISEQKKKEEQLKEAIIRYEIAVNGSNDGIWDWNLMTNELFFSEKWKQQLGYSGNEIDGTFASFAQNMHPDDEKRVIEFIGKYLNGDTINYDQEFRMLHKNGSYRWIRARGIAIRDNEGRPYRMAGSHTDITETKENELKIKKLSTVVEQSPAAIVITDTKGNIEYVNPHFTQITGFSQHEALGNNPRVLKTEYYPGEYYKLLWQSISNGEVWKGEFLNKRKNGTLFWESATIAPILNEVGIITNYVAIKQDITERKEIEKKVLDTMSELKNVNEQLQQAKINAENANRIKTEFLSNMSHELRTPLNSILGFSKMLKKQENINDKQKEQLTTIQNSGEHLLSLIDEILDMNKIEARKIEILKLNTNLVEVINTAFNINKIKADEKKLAYRLELSNNLPEIVLADARRLKQIMLNLIGNAVKFTELGTVMVKADFDLKNELFLFEVEDTGIGIPEERQSEIFEPFNRFASGRYYTEGTGLGLSITKRLTEMMEGSLSLKSVHGQGSKFMVQIPLKPGNGKVAKKTKKELNIQSYKGDRKKILIVDDNKANLLLLESLLENVGFVVETAENGKLAISKLTTFMPHLILLDNRMPGMTGVEFVNIVKENNAFGELKIIGVSAIMHQKELKRQFSEICDDFLTKPVEPALLFQKIGNLLHITWQYAPDYTETIPEPEILFPDENLVNQIKEHAELGMYNEILLLINKLAIENEQYNAFCNHILKLIKSFDSEKVISYLTKK